MRTKAVHRLGAGLALLAAGAGLLGAGRGDAVRPGPQEGAAAPAPAAAIRPLTPDSLLRFHVVANSDAPADQVVKLRVRDAVLPVLRALVARAATPAEAAQAVEAGRGAVLAAARRELAAAGRPAERVRLEVGHFDFPSTRYPGLDLPAGRYPAVRLVIGRGEGRNWWCVMFPMLCYPEWTGRVEEHPGAPAGPPPAANGSGPAVPALAPARRDDPEGERPVAAAGGPPVLLDERTLDELPVRPRLALLRWLERFSERRWPPTRVAQGQAVFR
ncbi:stage II sporulation protein R [Caldinitratiruptor microaerophilus]|uniref:Stage II sporulation protein R n=1 Tax=Caldinitratiruptor microaerophilus TaxID=671077 RepID=A0AA35CNT8_9FIRM|nr:stage II sporulation protein R [Caldinitratiruptor microaerophilus]BDG60745.1 hypothetical protein caldi_18350 [Caldinitratiruptor microaerophilus]